MTGGARRVGPTPIRLYPAPSYLAGRGAPRRLADLARRECVFYRADGVARWAPDGPRGRETVEVRGRISSDDVAFSRHAAIAGAGIAMVPAVVAAPEVAAGRLAPVLPRYGVLTGGLFLVHAGGRALPRRVALLRDFLAEALTPLVELEAELPPGRAVRSRSRRSWPGARRRRRSRPRARAGSSRRT